MKKLTTREMTKMALLVAVLAVSAYITIPLGFTPVGLTLQTLVINIIAIMLMPSAAFLTVIVYILLGFIGLPIFSGGMGGPAKLFGPTGGYIMAFLVSAPLMSFTKKYVLAFVRRFIKNEITAKITAYSVNAAIVGMIVVYLLGTIYMKFTLGAAKSWTAVLGIAVVPFIPLDLLKCVFAAVIAVPVNKALTKRG